MSEKIPERWWITPMEGCVPENVYQAFKARLMAELVASAERDSVIQHGRGDVREVSFHELVDRPHES